LVTAWWQIPVLVPGWFDIYRWPGNIATTRPTWWRPGMKYSECAPEMTKSLIEARLIGNGYGQQQVPGWDCSACNRLAVPNYHRAACRCDEPVDEHSHEWLADRFRLWVLAYNRGMHAVPGNLRT
jgi:hypothetical protein